MHRPSPETSHCRRPRISISWKLFAYLTLFTTFILIVVWVFQIGLLNYFYRQSKYRELDDAEKSLSQVLEQNPDQLEERIGQLSDKYVACIRVYRLRWTGSRGYAETLATSPDVSSGCLIHSSMNETYLTYLYKQAVGNGGEYTVLVSRDDQDDSSSSNSSNAYTLPSRPSLPGVPTWRRLLNSETVLRANVITTGGDSGGTVYMILINAEMVPLNATVQTLKTQFWVIAVILLCGAVTLAILISRNISVPI